MLIAELEIQAYRSEQFAETRNGTKHATSPIQKCLTELIVRVKCDGSNRYMWLPMAPSSRWPADSPFALQVKEAALRVVKASLRS